MQIFFTTVYLNSSKKRRPRTFTRFSFIDISAISKRIFFKQRSILFVNYYFASIFMVVSTSIISCQKTLSPIMFFLSFHLSNILAQASHTNKFYFQVSTSLQYIGPSLSLISLTKQTNHSRREGWIKRKMDK